MLSDRNFVTLLTRDFLFFSFIPSIHYHYAWLETQMRYRLLSNLYRYWTSWNCLYYIYHISQQQLFCYFCYYYFCYSVIFESSIRLNINLYLHILFFFLFEIIWCLRFIWLVCLFFFFNFYSSTHVLKYQLSFSIVCIMVCDYMILTFDEKITSFYKQAFAFYRI